jgi:hypothetical protein
VFDSLYEAKPDPLDASGVCLVACIVYVALLTGCKNSPSAWLAGYVRNGRFSMGCLDVAISDVLISLRLVHMK